MIVRSLRWFFTFSRTRLLLRRRRRFHDDSFLRRRFGRRLCGWLRGCFRNRRRRHGWLANRCRGRRRRGSRKLNVAFQIRRRGFAFFFGRRKRCRGARRRSFDRLRWNLRRRAACGCFRGSQPNNARRIRVRSRAVPTREREQNRDMRDRDDGEVAPEACVSWHRYFVSAFVAIPTLLICARCNASINVINFCTGNSRSGRMTTATSGFVCFNSLSWLSSSSI